MTVGMLLTAIFAAFNLAGKNDWPWYVIGLPMMIELGVELIAAAVFLAAAAWRLDSPPRRLR